MTGTPEWHLNRPVVSNPPSGFELSVYQGHCFDKGPSSGAVVIKTHSFLCLPQYGHASLLIIIVWTMVHFLTACSVPCRRHCGGGANFNQNCRAAPNRIQRVLRGTEVWDEGGMTSDEAGSTPRPLTRAQGNKAAVRQRRSESKEQTSRTTERWTKNTCWRN